MILKKLSKILKNKNTEKLVAVKSFLYESSKKFKVNSQKAYEQLKFFNNDFIIKLQAISTLDSKNFCSEYKKILLYYEYVD